MRENENKPMLISGPGGIPGFQHGNQKFCFLNLCLEVEMEGVTYRLTSEFADKTEMGEVIDTIELEQNQRQTA